MKKILVTISLICSMSVSYSALSAHSAIGKIQSIWAYDDYGQGDVIVLFNTGVTQCPNGAWLKADNPGFNQVLSLVLTAYTTNIDVKFQLRENEIWPGSPSTPYCRLRSIHYH